MSVVFGDVLRLRRCDVGAEGDPINAIRRSKEHRAHRGAGQVVTDPSGIDGREHALDAADPSVGGVRAGLRGCTRPATCSAARNLLYAQTHATVPPYACVPTGRWNCTLSSRLPRRHNCYSMWKTCDASRCAAALRDDGFAEDAIPMRAEAILPAVPEDRLTTSRNLERLPRRHGQARDREDPQPVKLWVACQGLEEDGDGGEVHRDQLNGWPVLLRQLAHHRGDRGRSSLRASYARVSCC